MTDDVRVVDDETFYKITGATTARHGYALFNNGKSRFEEGYRSIQLIDRIKDKAKGE